MSDCTYTFTDAGGQERTVTGMASMKAFLVDGGLDLFYPDRKYPWLKSEVAAAASTAARNDAHLPASVKSRLNAQMQPIKDAADGLQSARLTDRNFNGDGRYAAEFWSGFKGRVDSAREKIDQAIDSIPDAANRAAARAYVEENSPDLTLTPVEQRYLDGMNGAASSPVQTDEGNASNPGPKIDTSGQSVDFGAALDDTSAKGVDSQTAEQEATTKLTQAEAAKLMEWQDMGQRDGVKNHALRFYESQAKKDARSGVMTLVTVSNGDRSSDKWTVDGDDQSFTYLAAAKKRAMEVGMAKAAKDGFVESEATDQAPQSAKAAGEESVNDSLNKPHTIDKKRVITPSGAISAGARNSGADSSIWYHQGDIKMLAMTASVKIDGQLSKGADEAKRIVAAVSAAQKAGWALRNYRAGTLGTVWTLEKGDQFLTKAGLENINAEQIKDPQIPDYGPGWENMVRGQKDLATALFNWLKTLPVNQRENQAVVSRKMADVLGGWAYIERDKLGVHVRYKPAEKPDGRRVSGAQWTHTIPASPDWQAALQKIAEMAGGSFDAKDASPAQDKPQENQPSSSTLLDRHNEIERSIGAGTLDLDAYKQAFAGLDSNKDAVLAELNKLTKADLLRAGGSMFAYRMRDEKKDAIVKAAHSQMLGTYALGRSYGPTSYILSAGGLARHEADKMNALREMVANTTAEDLAQRAAEIKQRRDEFSAKQKQRAEAIESPKTLDDFRAFMRHWTGMGDTSSAALLRLAPEQRIQYDTLEAESTREARDSRKRSMQAQVRAAGQTTGGQIISTQHTRDGYDLFVVQLSDRLSKEDYGTMLASAKRLGGWYSSFRGNGATPGFQFKDRASAEAFLKLAGGDATAATKQVEQRRDTFEDDRSQTAVERLNAMADKLEAQAEEIEGRDRKTNTARRARFASAALAEAAADQAKAKTMRNIAQAIEGGKAKFLDGVRTKSQVDMLTGIVETAKAHELRAKHPSYADQEKRKGEPPTAETADFAEFPGYSAFRSDLASLARQLLDVEGTKKLGQRLMTVADDVTDAYLDFAKQNLLQVSQFAHGDALASFSSRDDAERAIRRSGLTGKAIVLPVKRGENRVILSPSEAISRGIWTGDGDKRITLENDFGAELVEAIGKRGDKKNHLTVPWQFQTAYDRRKALARIGIETPSEYRSALREFIGLKEQATQSRVRELELQMVGRKADGLDFFPTSSAVADQMVEAADLSPDMAVLEPSAGMGHLADRIRAAGAEPDVVEISPDRRELLEEKGYHLVEADDFMAMKPRKFFTYGDVYRAPDGNEGVMRGAGSMGSQRVRLEDEAGNRLGFYDRSELAGVRHSGTWSGYDRIIMNPPFSKRQDAEHVRHAYELLKPGGRIVAIMGEGVFFGQDQKAQDFRAWLESVGGTSEKLPDGSFMDPSLPVNTGVNARMVVIDRPLDGPSVLATANSTSPVPVSDQLSEAKFAQTIEERIGRFRHQPPVIILDSVIDLPHMRQTGAGAAKGMTVGGKIYLFRDANATVADVVETLWHELIHYGLRRFLTKGQYIGQMQKLYDRDLWIKAKADQWLATKGDGVQEAIRLGGMAYARARGVDEALAELAQINQGEFRTNTLKAKAIRQVARWIAAVAERFGFDAFAAKYRAVSNDEARGLVKEMFQKLQEDAPATSMDWAFTADPAFLKRRIFGDNGRNYTPEQLQMFQNVGRSIDEPTIKERIEAIRKDLGKRLVQGIVDQFSPLKSLDGKAYQLARLSKGASGAVDALLNHGKLSLNDGAYDADMSGGVLERLGVPLHGEFDDFLSWVAGNRAERLSAEDREHLFTPEDIAAAKSLADGQTNFDYTLQHGPNAGQVTNDRSEIYGDALQTFNEFHKNALDMAEQSGLIDPEARSIWENEFYVPFNRVSEEGFVGDAIKGGLVRQQAIKALKGGTDKLNDLMANTLLNWAHLIDAAAKNRAAVASLDAAQQMGVAIEASEEVARQMAKSMGVRSQVVWAMEGGKKRFFVVEDKAVMTALTSLQYAGLKGPIMDAMSTFKHALTIGVTASPAFKIRNLARDSVQAIASAPLSYNLFKNLSDGLKASDPRGQTYVSALASGGLIRFGTMIEGSEASRTRQLIRMGIQDSTILDSQDKLAAVWAKLEKGFMAYQELGNRGEEINRAALYKQLIDQGVPHGEAALQARDLMDFSLQGSFTTVRFLTQVVPFLNARLQGLYKLGRAAKEDPRRFATVLGAVALTSVALMLIYRDDDDWKKREDWDINNYWWLKFGGMAYRIPKPFEIGAIATLAERGLDYFINPEMTGRRLAENVRAVVMDQLSMNPIPQAVKPILDIYANKDSFSGRPIETMGMDRLRADYRYTASTSMIARGVSTAGQAVAETVNGEFLSPVQVDHLLRGYFSWLGSFVVGAADMALRPLTGQAERPTSDFWKVATQGIVQEANSPQSRYVSDMYRQAKEVEQAYATWNMLRKQGRVEEASQFRASNADTISRYHRVEGVKRREAILNNRIRQIERSNLSADDKRDKIRELQKLRDQAARMLVS